LRLIRSLKPNVALVDVHMPGMSGIELTERVSRAELSTRIVVVTVVDDGRFPKRLLDAGAWGYLTKGCNAEELVTAVRQVAGGKRYLAPAVAQQLALATLDGDGSPFDSLSSRELEVAMMLVRGKPLTVIGEQLNLSPKTVSTYKQRLMDKLQVDHVLGLAHLMTVHGLIDALNHQVGA
jgi:two-component system, NarL family, invasion response regulator UvrY